MQILCTLDGSPESEAVLPVVTRLARETHSGVILLTVVAQADLKLDGSEPEASFVTASGPGAIFRSSTSEMLRASGEAERGQQLDKAIDEARTYLHAMAQSLRDAGIEVEIEAVQGKASDEIISAAGRHAVDLIAMGTHGRTGLNALVHGSVVGAVVRSGVTPVVLVRPDTK
jgi:nucleotide-binding universal stress UspA family protein